MAEVPEISLTEHQRYWLEHVRACESSGKRITEYAADDEPFGLSNKILFHARFNCDGNGDTRRCEWKGEREWEPGKVQSGGG